MNADLPDTSPTAVGLRMTRVREALDRSQVILAAAMGVSPQRYGNYERGRRPMPHEMIARFCQITGATSDYLLFGRIETLPFDLARRLEARQPRQRDVG